MDEVSLCESNLRKAINDNDSSQIESLIVEYPRLLDVKGLAADVFRYAFKLKDHVLCEKILSKASQEFGIEILNNPSDKYIKVACELDDLKMVDLILRYGGSSQINSEFNSMGSDCPLQIACMNNCLDMVRLLLSYGALLNGEIMLAAVKRADLDLIKYLLDQGGKEFINYDGFFVPNCLEGACRRGDLSIVKLLQGAGALPLPRRPAQTIAYAAEAGFEDIVKHLLEQGSEYERIFMVKSKACYIICKYLAELGLSFTYNLQNWFYSMEQVADYDAIVDDATGLSRVLEAVYANDGSLLNLQLYLDHGYDPQLLVTEFDHIYAFDKSGPMVIRVLMSMGCFDLLWDQPEQYATHRQRFLEHCATEQAFDLVEIFLEHDVRFEQDGGLELMVSKGGEALIDILIREYHKGRFDLITPPNVGASLLMIAAMYFFTRSVRNLLAIPGIDVNFITIFDENILHRVIRNYRQLSTVEEKEAKLSALIEITNMLVDAGVNLLQESNMGVTVKDWYEKEGLSGLTKVV